MSSKNFQVISSKINHYLSIIQLEIADKPGIAKPQLKTYRPIKKLEDIVNEIAFSNSMIKNTMFFKNYDDYYKKISNHSPYTSFTKMTSLTKGKCLLKGGNNYLTTAVGTVSDKKVLTPSQYSIIKTMTKENTMYTTKYPNDIEKLKTPEDLHSFFVQMTQRGKKMEFDCDIEHGNY